MDGLSAFPTMCRHPDTLKHNGWCPICDENERRRREAYKREWYEQVNERLAALESQAGIPAPKRILQPTDLNQ